MVTRDDVAADTLEPQEAPATDLAALTSLLPRVTTATIFVMVAFAIFRGAHGSKAWDKAMFAVPVVLAALLCIQFLARPPRRVAGLVTPLLAAGGLLVGIGRIERQHELISFAGATVALPHLFWEGFGITIAIVSLVVALFLWRGLDWIDSSRNVRIALTSVVAVVSVCDLVSLIRTLSNFAEPTNNVFLLNEILAPAAGKVPDATFVPQYTTLQGWLLAPFRFSMSASTFANFAMIFMSVLGVLSVVLAVRIGARSMSSPALWLAAAIIVPLTCLTVYHGAQPYSSIASYMQQLPIRMFFAMLVSLLGLEELARLRRGAVRTWHLPALGVVVGLTVWNSQDFGIVVAIAFCMLLAVALPSEGLRKSVVLWSGGLLAGLVVYPVITIAAGTGVKLSDFGLFSRAFANGFASSPIQIAGPVMVVLPVLLSSASVGWCLLWRARRHAAPGTAAHDRAILTLALVGTWGTGGFVYYLNRSYASGQLQVLLMPCGVCLVALVALARDASPPGAAGSARIWWGLLPLALVASLGLASTLQSPSPSRTMKYLTDAPADIQFTSQLIPLSTLQSVESYVSLQGGTLAYYGRNGNYVHLWTGLQDNLILDVPTQAGASPALKRVACQSLADHLTTWVVISPNDEGTVDLCGLYSPVNPPGILPGILFERLSALPSGG